jgi:rhamnosyltransferase
MSVGLCVLTLNAGDFIDRWVAALRGQVRQPDRVVVIDSSSTDSTASIARDAGFEVVVIRREDFGHGRSRQLALTLLAECEVIVFMTQDALLASPRSLEHLLAVFEDASLDVAYGRQIPHVDAGPIARHARHYNYPPAGEVRSLGECARPGLQIAFCSDSFAAYRVAALLGDGGFPVHVMFGEDMYVAARCLLRGGKVAYVADAIVHHSHDYTVSQDFRRYFDVGVFHQQERWLLDRLGEPEARGAGFVVSELRYLTRHAPMRVPEAALRVFARYLGYRTGRLEKLVPRRWKKRWTMCGHFRHEI